jgi:coenzyme PQQ precursor peptide PqqA
MREWHKPTVEETESSMEVTNYLPAERIALNPSLLILRNRNGGPAGAAFWGFACDIVLAASVCQNFPFRFS